MTLARTFARPLAKTLGVATAVLLASTASAADLDLTQPRDALTALRKMQCSTRDEVPVVYHWSGTVWSRVQGEPDRLLFNIEGMNVRQCVTVTDPVRGTGFRMVSRELMLYLDPQSGEVLRTWTNPWTQQTVTVMQVANDPVNMRPSFERDAQGRPFSFPFRQQGDRIFAPTVIPLFYTNPLGGEYQDYAGGHYHAMEIFDFLADRHTLLDEHTETANAALAWVRVAPWLPWMRMGSRPGTMIFNAMGQTVEGVDALPAPLRTAIANDYPAYAVPPPVTDTRPNATSWTVAREAIDAERRANPAPARPAGHGQ